MLCRTEEDSETVVAQFQAAAAAMDGLFAGDGGGEEEAETVAGATQIVGHTMMG